MGSIRSFERWDCKSAIAYTEGRAVRFGLFGPGALAWLAARPRLRWIRLEGIAPLGASYQSITAREEKVVVAMSAQLHLHGRRVFDHEITLSNRCCDLLILVSRAPTSHFPDVESHRDLRGDVASVPGEAMLPYCGGQYAKPQRHPIKLRYIT